MDARLRRSVLARDGALGRIGRLTRLIAWASFAGALVLMAGFAHLLPTHLPHVSTDQGSGSGGLQGPQSGPSGGSGSSQVTSGGS